MTRQTGLVAALVAVLLVVLFYFFVWSPRSEEIAEIEEQIETVEQQQAQLETRLRELREVRANAPELEADIVSAESIVPRDVGQAAAIRQLQLAADESGVELPNVTFTRPEQIQDAVEGLASLGVSAQVTGGYYQIVDFYRRVEDPVISPRGIIWDSVAVTVQDYPTLNASSSGSMFSLLPTPPAPPDEEEANETNGADEDVDVVEEEAG